MSIAVVPVRAKAPDCFCLFARLGHEVNATTEVHDACGGSLRRSRRGGRNTYQRSPARQARQAACLHVGGARHRNWELFSAHESQENLKRLFLGVGVELLEATFTPDAAVLIAAERNGARVAVDAVDPDITGLKALRRTQRLRDVLGPDRSR